LTDSPKVTSLIAAPEGAVSLAWALFRSTFCGRG
jgi:hypothetical protein